MINHLLYSVTLDIEPGHRTQQYCIPWLRLCIGDDLKVRRETNLMTLLGE
jgi:hypothetical protein